MGPRRVTLSQVSVSMTSRRPSHYMPLTSPQERMQTPLSTTNNQKTIIIPALAWLRIAQGQVYWNGPMLALIWYDQLLHFRQLLWIDIEVTVRMYFEILPNVIILVILLHMILITVINSIN